MAIVKQCDRCGKFYNHYPTEGPSMYNALRRIKMNDIDTFVRSSSLPIDLCKECMWEFDKFMDMKKLDSSAKESL